MQAKKDPAERRLESCQKHHCFVIYCRFLVIFLPESKIGTGILVPQYAGWQDKDWDAQGGCDGSRDRTKIYVCPEAEFKGTTKVKLSRET